MDVSDPFNSLQLCISKCPDKLLVTTGQVKKYAEDTNIRLCDYSIDPKDYLSQDFSKRGPCPKLPILKRYGEGKI